MIKSYIIPQLKNRIFPFLERCLKSIPAMKEYVDEASLAKKLLYEKILENNHLKSLIASSRSPGLLGSTQDILTERLMSHPVMVARPKVLLASEPAISKDNRISVAERLIASYHKSIEDEVYSSLRREGEDLWTGLLRNELPELISCVENRQPVDLADYLKNFGQSYVWFGGITTCVDGYNKNLDRCNIALTYLDKLIALAESIGVLNYESPEYGSWGENLHKDVNQLIKDIECVLEINIAPPLGIIHTDGIASSYGVFHYRHINALYCAIRMSKLNPKHGAVCELGGGLGIAALYARRLGYKDYTLLDLPISCLLAGHYLLHAVGEENICLYGETLREDCIKIMPYWECRNLESKHYEITVNQDSIPEIVDNLVYEYLTQIKRLTKSAFLSINHEYFFPRTVNNYTLKSGGFQQIYRSKCWVREGYIEEAYKILT